MSLKRATFEVKARVALRPDRRMYDQLMRDAVLEPDELEKLQARRAIDHARFAMQHTEFYRTRYSDAGFTLKDLEDPAAFSELPMVTKADVRDDPDRFRSSEATAANSKVSATGGSTGQPLHLLRDLRTPTRTLEWRLLNWWGLHPSDNVAILTRKTRTPEEMRRYKLLWWPSQRIQLDAFRMDDEHIDAFLKAWHRTSPDMFIGYVGGIAELATIFARRGIHVRPPRAIAVTAAPLTPAQRATIESTFNAPVYDHYRSSEVPWIAGECRERNGLHTFADVRKIEILNPDGRPAAPGAMGEVVLSDLTNRVFPLIRYRIGDRSSTIAEACPCGVTLPRITAVAGRLTDALRLPSGRVVPGEGMAQAFSKTPHAVLQFQIHQLADYSVTVRCVPSSDPTAMVAINKAVDNVRFIVDNTVPVRLEILDNIPHDGGKIRFIKCDVPAS
jgi:phenylacetate-CoA ligase